MLFSQQITEDVPTSFATPLKSPRKTSSSSQIPLFMFITIPRLLYYLRINSPHTSHIWGNLTSRAHQFRCLSVLAYDRQHNNEHDLPKPVQEEERHTGVSHHAQDGPEARNRPPKPRTNPTQSLLVTRGERRVTNEPVCGDS